MSLDPSRYPRAASYIDSLPEGPVTFPSCRMNNHVLEHATADLPGLGSDDGLPPR